MKNVFRKESLKQGDEMVCFFKENTGERIVYTCINNKVAVVNSIAISITNRLLEDVEIIFRKSKVIARRELVKKTKKKFKDRFLNEETYKCQKHYSELKAIIDPRMAFNKKKEQERKRAKKQIEKELKLERKINNG